MAAKPILVTGAAGFIGARFVDSCVRKGISVISVDLPEHFRSRTEHSAIDFGEIISREDLLGQLETQTPFFQSIVHLGACSSTTEMDVEYLKRVNVDYSKSLWNYATRHQLPFVYASSAATYGGGEQGYADEESQMASLKPLNPYGDSKLQFDLWALEQEQQGQHPPSWSGFKFFNVYGFGERHKVKMSSVVLQAFDQIRSRGRVNLFRSHREGIADGHQSRDFIFVGDVVEVLHFALEKPIERGIFNLGTGEARTFLDLVRAVFLAMEEPEAIDFIDTPEAIRDRYQYFTEASMDRLRAAGYEKPFTSLEEGVRQVVQSLQAEAGK